MRSERLRDPGGLRCPGSVTIVDPRYHAIRAALAAVDVSVLIDDNEYLLGFVGVDSEGRAWGFSASPRFGSLDDLEAFCRAHAREYELAGALQYRQCACRAPEPWRAAQATPAGNPGGV